MKLNENNDGNIRIGLQSIMSWLDELEAEMNSAPTANCPRHGDYKLFNGTTSCPKCEQEAKEKRARQEYRQILLEHSGLEINEQMARFANYQATSEKAEEIKQELLNYAFDHNLILSGTVGTGKTHLASALVRKACLQDRKAYFTTLNDFLREMKQAQRFSSEESEYMLLNRYASVEFLVIDELEEFINPQEARLFNDLLSARYRKKLPTCLITNLSLQTLSQVIDIRVLDRLKENIRTYVLDWQSYRTGNKS